jgi:DNA-binding response OmpR family regulator
MKKILYVEDNIDTATAVKILLETVGYGVELAYNGTDGLKKAQEHRFDLILLDVMLPDMSGWDIFEKIKDRVKAKYAFLSAIPVSDERMRELKKAGVSEYIMKPFTKADLISRITKVLGVHA